jgi:hypothetical protein
MDARSRSMGTGRRCHILSGWHAHGYRGSDRSRRRTAVENTNLYRITVGSESTGNPTWGKLDRTRLHRGLLTDAQLDSDPSNPKPTTANTLLSFDFNEAGMPFSSSIAPVAVLDQDGGEIAAEGRVVQWSPDNP